MEGNQTPPTTRIIETTEERNLSTEKTEVG